MPFEDAQIADPTKKVVIAVRRIIFRPQIFENLAHTGVAAALARRYADLIYVYVVAECSSLIIVGIAVVAIVKSNAARNNESWQVQVRQESSENREVEVLGLRTKRASSITIKWNLLRIEDDLEAF